MKIKELYKNLPNLFSIHYSSESLNDENENISPRITSITLTKFETRFVHSFAIHLEAEKQKIVISDVKDKYDELEASMLINFFEYLSENINNVYIHWNMRSVVFGFEALEHRYNVLTNKQAYSVPENNRYNLSDLLKDKYGKDYVSHKRMPTLMHLNGGLPQFFLSGADEVQAFKDYQFIKLYQSSAAKSEWLRHIFFLALNNGLKVEKSGYRQKVVDISESTIFKILGLIGIILSIAQFIIGLISSCTKN